MVRNTFAASLLGRVACLGVAFTLSLVAGCGGTNSTITTVTVSSVSITCSPSTITMGQTSTCSATVTYSDNSTDSNVTYSATGGTVTGGVFSPSATGTGTVTATAVKDSTKSKTANVTVNAAAVTVSSVSITCSPSTITMGQTSTCSATVTYSDNSTDSNVTFTATGGTVTGGVFSPSATGTGTVTATAVKDSTKSKTANVTVNAAAVRQITALTPRYATADANVTVQYTVTCNGCTQGDQYDVNSAAGAFVPLSWPSSAQTQSYNSLIQIGGAFEPVWFTATVCDANGNNCGNQYSSAFLGTASGSTLVASGQSGPLYQVQEKTGQVYSENVGGSPSVFKPNTLTSNLRLIAVDDLTGNVVYAASNTSATVYDKNGAFVCALTHGFSSISSVAARGGFMAFASPTDNKLGIAKMDCTGFQSVSVAGQPWSLSMTDGTAGNAIYVLSRDKGVHALPTLEKFNFSGVQQGAILDLQNVTPESTVRAACATCGIWQIAALQGQKKLAVNYMSTESDGLIVFVNTDTMTVSGSASTAGVLPTLIVPDDVNNVFWVGYLNSTGGDAITYVGEANPSSNSFTANKAQFPSGILAGGMVMTNSGLVGAMDSQFTAPIAVTP